MMIQRRFQASELGARLRKLRIRAQLTQDDVAERMGLVYSTRKMTVMLLETGRTANPTVGTLGRFLRACGARWSDVTDLLDSQEPVEIDARPLQDSEFDVRDRQRLESAVEKQVRKYELKLALPAGGKPLHPAKQAETVRKLRNYRMVATIVEQAVSELLKTRPVSTIEYPRLKMVAREALGLLWREARGSQKSKVRSQKSERPEELRAESKEQTSESKDEGRQMAEEGDFRMQSADCRLQNQGNGDSSMQSAKCELQIDRFLGRLAEKVQYWEMQKLDGKLVRDVQSAAVRRFAALQESNPELFGKPGRLPEANPEPEPNRS
jgi:transcriptional regulator with XRE-family HTH domain